MKQIRKVNNLAITIMMIVILLVALSTATFAWFSASNIVNLSRMDFTIGMNGGAGDLMISWGRYENYMTSDAQLVSYSLDNVTTICGVIGAGTPPSMPKVAPYKGMSIDAFVDNLYSSQVIPITEGNQTLYYAFRSNGVQIEPCYVKKSDAMQYSGDFYIYNINPDYDLDVSIEMKVSGAPGFRMVVFVDDKLEGIVGNTDRIAYGPIVRGANVENMNYVNQGLTENSANDGYLSDKDCYNENTEIITSTFSFRLSTIRKIRLLAYFDGNSVFDVHEGRKASIDMFRFMGEYIEKE